MSEKAWQLIDQVGWCQGQSVKRKGTTIIGYCVMGAIREAYGEGVDGYDALDTVRAVIGGGGLAAWNDAPERTKEQVVATLKGVNV